MKYVDALRNPLSGTQVRFAGEFMGKGAIDNRDPRGRFELQVCLAFLSVPSLWQLFDRRRLVSPSVRIRWQNWPNWKRRKFVQHLADRLEHDAPSQRA